MGRSIDARFIAGAAFVLLVASCADMKKPAVSVDLRTPDATMQTVLLAIERLDFGAIKLASTERGNLKVCDILDGSLHDLRQRKPHATYCDAAKAVLDTVGRHDMPTLEIINASEARLSFGEAMCAPEITFKHIDGAWLLDTWHYRDS